MIGQLLPFVLHCLRAQSRYAVHSPFVYELVTQILPPKSSDWGRQVDQLRQELLRDTREVDILDLGAGYSGQAQAHIRKSIREVVRSSARKRKNGELLSRLSQWLWPGRSLELGTNLGISTLYQAGANPNKTFVTVEGAPELAEIARQNFDRLGLKNADLRVGEFSGQIQLLKEEGKNFDYVLLDGNHRYQSTVNYFKELLPLLNPEALVIVDDINWSDGMRKAWSEIAACPEVSVSVDLFFMGLCFVKRNQEKEHFSFRWFPF